MDKTWFNMFYNKELDENQVEIYDQIGFFGISASQFSAELRALDNSKKLKMHINSPGGDVFEGIAIYNIINEYPGEKTVVINGIAASIASVIAMAGDKIQMYDTASMMIHKPYAFSVGDADQHRSDANVLDNLQANIKKAYQSQSEMEDNDLDNIINGKNSETPGATWMDADQALEKGFITEVIKQKKKDREKNSLEKKIMALQSHEMFAKFQGIPNRIAACIRPVAETVKPDTKIVKEEKPTIENKVVVVEINNQKKESPMTPEEIKAAQEKAVAEASEKALTNERLRQSEIRASGKLLNMPEAVIENAIEKGMAFAEAAKVFHAEVAKTVTPVTVAKIEEVKVTADDSDKFRAQACLSLQNAAGLITDKEKKVEARKAGGPASLHGFFRTILARQGVKGVENLDGNRLVETFHNSVVGTGTGDLANVLADTLNKALDLSLAATRTTYQAWTKMRGVKDFRQFSYVKLSGVSNLKEIKEHESFKIGALSDKKEVGTLKTQGILMSLTRQAQINDDLGALVDMGTYLGREVQEAKDRDCYDTLYGSAGVGPTLTETARALFNTTEGNLVTSGAVPSTTTLDAAQLAIMTRTKLKARQDDVSVPTGALPRFLIVPPYQKGAAERLVYSTSFPDSTYNQGVYNQYNKAGSNPMDVICSAYLGSLSAYGWYVATDPNEIATLILLTLNGNENPIIESAQSSGSDPLGINFRCYHDWAWMVGDWRGLYLNDGVA